MGLGELLASPRLSLPAGVRAVFAQGGVDPRLVSVLGSAVEHHSVVVGGLESVVDPVHAQSVNIVSVDGEPVGPGNVGARDLVTEIAALDPSVRPSEIGTPWPIQSQGFFSGPGQQAQLHLAFVSQGDYQAPAGGGVGGAGAVGVADAQLAQAGPVAASPAAQGAAQAAAQMASGNAPVQPAVQAAPPLGQPAPASNQLVGQGMPAAVDGITSAASAGAAVPGWTSSQSAVAAQLFKTFTGAGLSPAGASALIGNWMQESSLNPSEPGGFLAQWGGSRLSELTSQYGPNPSAAQQAQFALQELRGGYPSLLEQLKTTNDPRSAALAVSSQYERPNAALANNANREAQAAAALAAFGTTQGAPQTPAAQVVDVGQSPADAGAAGAPPAPACRRPAAAGVAGAPAGVGAAAAASDPANVAGQAGGAAGVGQAGGAVDTGAFKAAQPHEPHFHRHTVQFLAAVQPSPDSPLYAQEGGAGQAGQVADVAGATPAGQQPGQVAQGVAGQQQPGQAAELVQGQGAGVASAMSGGGSISVSSSLLTPGQEKFAGRVAELTGLDPRVVSAWELAEESGSAAQGREAAGNFDWLNIGYTDSANLGTKDSIWNDPIKAAEATAGWIKGKDTIPGYGTASSGIQAILNTVGKSPREQMMAIANSGWASSHYGNGANLIATYDELSDLKVAKV